MISFIRNMLLHMETLWENLPSWKKKMTYEEGKDYELVDVEDTTITGVKLLLDKYKGIVYCYGGANVQELDGVAKLKFDYIILESPNHSVEELADDAEFHIILGDILVEMITVGDRNEQTRKNNPEEFDLQ